MRRWKEILIVFLAIVDIGFLSILVEPRVMYELEERIASDTLSDWQVLQMAIMYTESEFDPSAVGKAGDSGAMQITPVYVSEANRLAGTDYTLDDAFDLDLSLEMFDIVQKHRNPERDIDKAIRLHNKAPWYRKRVKENMAFIRRMEKARTKLMEYEHR